MKAFIRLMFLLCLLQTATAKPLVLPLASMMTRSEAIVLRQVTDDYVLHFPVSSRRHLLAARLHLDFTHSNVLVGSRSQLRVQINGVTVGQWRLQPQETHRIVELSLPTTLLVPGYNEIRLAAALHYTDVHCEDPSSPELWLEINPVKSHLTLEQEPASIRPSLAELPTLIAPTVGEDYAIRLLMPGTDLSERQLSWGALVTEGIALRRDYAPFRLALASPVPATDLPADTAVRLRGNEDTILIGTREQLRSLLGETVHARIRNAYLGLFPLPQHPEHFVLVVSGTTPEEVERAGRAFALLNFPLPDSAETLVEDVELDTLLDYQAIPATLPDTTFRFSHFGFETHTFQGIRPEPAAVDLFVPGDWFAPESAQVTLGLHLAYSAGLRRDSFLEMRINGVLERAIQLPEESGAQYRDYRLSFPLRSLQPGHNRISFHAYPAPAITGQCGFFPYDQLKITLYDDSRIHFPAVGRQTELPDLALLARTGYPYLMQNGAHTQVVVATSDRDEILAAWQLLGKLARINRLPLFAASIGFTPDPRRHQLIISRLSHLKPAWLQGAPVDPTATWKDWAYQSGWHFLQENGWRKRLERWLEGLDTPPARAQTRYARVRQSGGLGEEALALSFTRPDRRLTTVLTAEQGLYPAVRSLTEPGLWSQLQGDTALWKTGAKRLHWQQLGEKTQVGPGFSPRLWLTFHFERHPWRWLGAIAALVILFTWLTHRRLSRFKKKHHPDAEEIAP
ncbi:cellulose synthase operon protein B [Methylomarinovum tepidoasis]|uniref:Cyclic di-GMP-binding protein n=1 Tax=Methylomarinovum tepidoasis TaxID=2840183 RepID=A0AAU9CD19_9GAMM|nr:cellulose biosynthesis cyclic di-GMP-binding regulatory protein BcsB [Methylomarinovum sp. IN45]BCX88696.1 cellulose synthase operon protein B [Methylomarinovum sp. IN45]